MPNLEEKIVKIGKGIVKLVVLCCMGVTFIWYSEVRTIGKEFLLLCKDFRSICKARYSYFRL